MRKSILVCSSLIFILSGCATIPNHCLDGKNFYTKGQVEKSVQEFERLDKAYPGTSTFWLCKLYSETGEYAKAVKGVSKPLTGGGLLRLLNLVILTHT